MTDVSSFYSIEQIVEEALLELPERENSEREFHRYLNFALSGLRRLRVMVTKDGIKRSKITPNSLNRYDFPDDMEEFISLYVPVDGRIWRLTKDKGIIPTKTVVGLDESNDDDYGEGVDQPVEQLNTFASVGGINKEGYYNINYEDREIVINNTRKTELVLEYATLGSTSIIPTKYVEALKAWIYWKSIHKDPIIPMNSKLEAENQFNKEVRKVKNMEIPHIEVWFDSWQKKSLIR